MAQQTLAGLARHVDTGWVAQAKAELRREEHKRRDDPATQWRRLLLSERHWGDPQYLSTQASLPDALSLEHLELLASQVFPARNQVLLRLLPRIAKDDEADRLEYPQG